MGGAEVVSAFWDRIKARDWEGVGRLLSDDVLFEWPHSLERFRGRSNVVGMNRAYPEGWSIEVLRVLDSGEVVVSEVKVPFRDEAVFFVASFFEVRDGLIRRAVEYWVESGQEEPPAWRRAFREPMTDPG
jgi:ketosteroid isomerase-like protein